MCLTWEKLCLVGITLFCVRRLSFVNALLPWNNLDICRARFSCLEIQNSLPSLQTRVRQTGPFLDNQAGVCQEAPQNREVWPVLGHGAVQEHPYVVHRVAPLLKAHRGGVQGREELLPLPHHFPLSCHLLFSSKCFSLSPHSATGNLTHSTYFCLLACGQVYLPCVL